MKRLNYFWITYKTKCKWTVNINRWNILTYKPWIIIVFLLVFRHLLLKILTFLIINNIDNVDSTHFQKKIIIIVNDIVFYVIDLKVMRSTEERLRKTELIELTKKMFDSLCHYLHLIKKISSIISLKW